MGERQLTIGWTIAAQVAGWVVAAMLTYSAINARVAVVEDRVNSLKSDIAEMKADIKTLILRKP